MNIQFCDTKDGLKTFSLDNVYFHSRYAPLTEAERFAQTIKLPYKAKIIFLVEPGLCYCYPFIKDKYPDSKIIIIRLIDYELPGKDLVENIVKFAEIKNFKSFLIQKFGEEALLSSGLFIWPPAQNLFKDQLLSIVQDYKAALEECKTLLVTRQFFEKKWLINSCNFIINAENFIQLKNTLNLPVLVCASGPSLEPCLNIIKKYENKLFIIALSSAFSPLIQNKIIPDLVLSTDGGFWAGEHLKLLARHPEIPVACPSEAYIPKKILKHNPILPLEYDDSSSFISSQIIKEAGINAYPALRNPTVSGTALFFANSISSGKVYFAGLDLHAQAGLQHSRPNELEKNNSLAEYRLNNKEKLNTRSRYNSSSLTIYEEWFRSIDQAPLLLKTFRVIDSEYEHNPLGQIKEINSRTFAEELKKIEEPDKDKNNFFTGSEKKVCKKEAVLNFILNELEHEKWQKQLFPADFISIQNGSSENSYENLLSKIDKLKNKIRKLLDE